MRRTGWIVAICFALGAALVLVAVQMLATPSLHAQPPGIKRAVLLKTALDGVEGKELIMVSAELDPGVSAGKHYHPGDEILYILEGTSVLELDGRPAVTLKAGDSYHVPAGVHHDVRNAGTTTGKALVIFVVDEGKPLAVPVP